MKHLLYDRFLALLIFRTYIRGRIQLAAELARLRAAERRAWRGGVT